MADLIYRQRTVDGRLVRIYDVFDRATDRQLGVVERPGAGVWVAMRGASARRFPERRLAGEWLKTVAEASR